MASTSKFEIKKGDLLLATEDFKCHQCNCVSTKSLGLASYLFDKYPTTNTYLKHKIAPSIPGTADVFKEEGVANLYGQYQPGSAMRRGVLETFSQRHEWLRSALQDMLLKVPPNSSFAFPYMIGCSLAGGQWSHYKKILEEFAQDERVKRVVVYSLVEPF